MDPTEMITIVVKELGERLGYTDGNEIALQMSAVYYYPLHEVVHTFAWNDTLIRARDSVWLTEGFAEYLGKLIPIYPQLDKHCAFEDLNGRVHDQEMSILLGKSFWYFLDSEQFTAAKAW